MGGSILILEQDKNTAYLLRSALSDAGIKAVLLAHSMREACMILAKERVNLAILPLTHAEHRIRVFRQLQPGLAIALNTGESEGSIPEKLQEQVQGILSPELLERQLPPLLAQQYPTQVGQETIQIRDGDQQPLLMVEAFKDACGVVDAEKVLIDVVFASNGRILAQSGRSENSERIADKVGQTWDKRPRTAQIQYFQPGQKGELLLLYTRQVNQALLTLVAAPETPVTVLRSQADRLATRLSSVGATWHPPPPRPLPAEAGAITQREPISLPAAAEPPAMWVPPRLAVTGKMPLDAFINLGAFLLPRLFFAALVLLTIIFLTYMGLDMASGTDFVTAIQEAVPETITYIHNLLQGDLGMTATPAGSIRSVPVTDVLTQWLPRSLGLLAISMIFASVMGLILGINAARRGSKRSLGIIVATIIGVSVPSFFAAFLLQWAITSFTRYAGRPLLPVGGFGWDSHLILPVLVLAARPLAQITRITFTSVDEVLHKDYVRTAHSKGLRRYQVMGQHIMRNSAIPILTTIGVSLSFALTGLPIVEFYFGWLGAGFLLLKGIAQQDENLTVALVLCFGLIFIVVNLLLDISYRFIDPRLKERPSYVTSKERQKPSQSIRNAGLELWDLLSDNALVNWFKQRRQVPVASPFQKSLERSGIELLDKDSFEAMAGGRSPWRAALRNPPLVVGAFLLFILLVAVLAGPFLAPHSPYTTQGLVEIDGQLTPPPFSPSTDHPWGTDALGRDIMSLILAGAKQTLLLAVLAVIARMGVGILLGAIAGWTNGSRLDRLIVGTAEVIAAYPTLLLTMIIILAIGIREGMMPFIIALCIVGWGETMQFVRSEVTSLRPKPFVESAIAIGARTPRIIGRHILPILFSSLISIAALEMGSVLMLLGELGFINIFIGGGALIELPTGAMLYSDVPEWGALLSNVRLLARGYPWTALFPMLAFFVAVLSFNLFGEGIRRMVAKGHLIFDRLINRYTVVLGVATVLVAIWLRHNSGAMPTYRQQARAFDGERAISYIMDLADPALEGRALGSAGMDRAADYMAEQFIALDLQAGGQKNTFFQERRHAFERLESIPTLTIDDSGQAPVYGRDFAAFPSATATIGQAAGAVRFIGLGRPSPYQVSTWRPTYPELERTDLSGSVLLTLSEREADILDHRATNGLLVVTDDPEMFDRRFTLGGLTWREDSPRLWISEEVANRILAGSGYTVADMRQQVAGLTAEALLDMPLTTTVSMTVDGTIEEKWPVRNVIGYLPGTSGMEWCQICLGDRLIVVMVQYDSPPIGPKGEIYPAANDNASGLAVMLEAIRVMQETEYQPFKSFVFIAYSGEGLDGGEFVNEEDIHRFLQAKTGFTNFNLEAVVHLRGLGGGSGDHLEISAGGSLRLAELFERSAKQMGVDVVRADDAIDIGVIYDEGNSLTQGGQEAPVVRLFWEGWEEHARLPSDTISNVSTGNLQDAGRALAMALMILGREVNY